MKISGANSSKGREWLKDLVKSDLGLLSGLFLVIIVNVALSAGLAVFYQILIDKILIGGNWEKLTLAIIVLSCVLTVNYGLIVLRQTIALYQTRRFNFRIMTTFLEKLVYLPKSFFDTKKIGDLIARMNDSTRVQEAVKVIVEVVLVKILVAIISLVLLFKYSVTIGILVAMFIPPFILVWYIHSKPMTEGWRKVSMARSVNQSGYTDLFLGIDTIQVNNKEHQFISKVLKNYNSLVKNVLSVSMIGVRNGGWVGVVRLIGTVLFMALCSYYVMNGFMKIGEMMAVTMLSGMFMEAVVSIVVSYNRNREAKVAFERLVDYMYSNENRRSKNDFFFKMDQLRKHDTIKMEKVHFSFQGGGEILKGVDLEIKAKAITSLIGNTGSGKTTIIKLLTKGYPPDQGKILLNEFDLQNIDVKSWRDEISIVPQEIKIFNSTFLENVCLDSHDLSNKKLDQIIDKYNLGGIFRDLPQGYSTMLGEADCQLSGGQKQILGLLRAIYKNPKWLFLDEVTSALDISTEKTLLGALYQLKQEMGILFITHRIYTIQNFDYIYILDNGKIINHGTPENLSTGRNLFSDFFDSYGIQRIQPENY